jgi:protein TonB
MILELLAIATVAAPALDAPYPPAITAPPPQAPAGAKPPHIITNPQWLKRPNGGDFSNLYPRKALRAGISGHTSMECVIKRDGTLTACRILSETPAEMGFGAAELRLAGQFKMRPQTLDGMPVSGAKVVIPIAWKVAVAPPPAPLPPLASPPADPAPH